jgi:hypothetical protein
VAAARACIGARFRPHGRDAGHGLDCVGVAAAAYGIAVPGGYALRGGDPAAVAAAICGAGFSSVAQAEPGDLLLIQAGHAQLHLAVKTACGIVQAHAGLRRVVETPGAPDAPVLGVFRAGE